MENKVKVHVFQVPLFVALLTKPLSLCVSDDDRKIKENSLHFSHKQKNLKSYLTYFFSKYERMNQVIKFMLKQN